MKWSLERPHLSGASATLWAIAAVAAPTALRCMVDDQITGVAFSPYIPFVLAAALALGWRYAAAVALAAAAVADLMFIDPRYVFVAGPTDVFGMLVFLVSATLIIIMVEASRRALHARPKPAPCGDEQTGIIFSLEQGQAWLTWSDSGQPVRLGPESEVSAMMQDFLAQLEVGKRLNRATCGSA